jgi:hypothetical protein
LGNQFTLPDLTPRNGTLLRMAAGRLFLKDLTFGHPRTTASSTAFQILRNANLTLTNVSIHNFDRAVVAESGGIVTVESSILQDNNVALQAETGGSIRISNNLITDNRIALSGGIVSFVNNRIYGNITNGSPSQSVYQK